MLGPGVLGEFISIHFSAPLDRYLPHPPNFLHFVQNEEMFGVFVPTNGDSRWTFGVVSDPGYGESAHSFTPERAADLVRRAAGVPGLEVEIAGMVPWKMQADSAEGWRAGNVFLVGDAAHRMTPAGGLGLNTGIQDVHNLCWKLAAVLQGWAGPRVLETYEAERQPVAKYNLDHSVGLVTGAANASERTGLDIDLGFAYSSTAVHPDGTEPARRPDGDYEPVARPGSRAPHFWLGGRARRASTLDLLGPHFTVLAGRRGQQWSNAACEVARELGVPLLGRAVSTAEWAELYGVEDSGAVLVRPDGHVAWRGPSAVASPMVAVRQVLSTILSRPCAGGKDACR